MVRSILLLTLVAVGCIQPPPMERYPVAEPPPEYRTTPPSDPYPQGQPQRQPQDQERPTTSGTDTPRNDPYPSGSTGPAQSLYPQPFTTEVGLIFGNDTAWLQTRTAIKSGTLVDAGFYFSEDDFVFDIGLLRVGRTEPDSPLSIGAGVGFYAGSLADPLDWFSAIVLTGIAAYDLGSSLPARILGQISYAPDVTTFGDGDSLVDLRAGVDLELSPQAAVFVGYRFFEIGVDEADNRELEDGAYFGVRLGF